MTIKLGRSNTGTQQVPGAATHHLPDGDYESAISPGQFQLSVRQGTRKVGPTFGTNPMQAQKSVSADIGSFLETLFNSGSSQKAQNKIFQHMFNGGTQTSHRPTTKQDPFFEHPFEHFLKALQSSKEDSSDDEDANGSIKKLLSQLTPLQTGASTSRPLNSDELNALAENPGGPKLNDTTAISRDAEQEMNEMLKEQLTQSLKIAKDGDAVEVAMGHKKTGEKIQV